MQRNIQILLQNLSQNSHVTKRELFNFTKRARNYASIIKPLNAFTNNIETHGQHNKLNITSNKRLKSDINSFQNNITLYNENKKVFDSVFSPSKRIDITAYCSYVHHHGIAGFVDVDDTPYFKLSFDEIPQTSMVNLREQNELLSIYILLKLYAHTFKGKRVQIYCDNLPVINMLNQYTAKPSSNPYLQTLITKIATLCMQYKINIFWSRIGGVPLIITDRLARSINNPFQYSQFKPQSTPNPVAFQYLDNIFHPK